MSKTQIVEEAHKLWQDHKPFLKIDGEIKQIICDDYVFNIRHHIYKGEKFVDVKWNDELIDQWKE